MSGCARICSESLQKFYNRDLTQFIITLYGSDKSVIFFSCFIIGIRILISLLNSCQHHFGGICCFNKCFMHFFNFMCLVFHTISTNALLKTEYETSSI